MCKLERNIECMIQDIITLAKKYQISKVILFGSRARGDYKERSDIDLAIMGGNTVRFSTEIEEDLHTLLLFDIVDLDAPVQYKLRDSISREEVIIYEKVWKFL